MSDEYEEVYFWDAHQGLISQAFQDGKLKVYYGQVVLSVDKIAFYKDGNVEIHLDREFKCEIS